MAVTWGRSSPLGLAKPPPPLPRYRIPTWNTATDRSGGAPNVAGSAQVVSVAGPVPERPVISAVTSRCGSIWPLRPAAAHSVADGDLDQRSRSVALFAVRPGSVSQRARARWLDQEPGLTAAYWETEPRSPGARCGLAAWVRRSKGRYRTAR